MATEDGLDFTQSSLEYWLTIEFKNLVPFHRRPTGMYVMPAFDSMLKWYGVMFVQQGYYRKGVFKFVIDMPRTYPNERPNVTFLTTIYHPYVRSNGQLDLSLAFPNWVPKKHFIIHVLQFIKKMFYKIDVLHETMPRDAPNPEALELYRKDTIEFFHCAQRCVADCEHHKYTNPQGCSIRFLPFEDKEELYQEALQHLCMEQAAKAADDGEQPQVAGDTKKAEGKGSTSSYTRHIAWFVEKAKGLI